MSASYSEAFWASISMIIVSELGDKTFFIAAILAMRHGRLIVFSGAIAALAVMTILSAAMGFALPNILPKVYTHYASVLLFAVFGVKLLKDVVFGEAEDGNHELEEVEQELGEVGSSGSGRNKKHKDDDIETGSAGSGESSLSPSPPRRNNPQGSSFVLGLFPPVFIQALTMTFLAEWGDRSPDCHHSLGCSRRSCWSYSRWHYRTCFMYRVGCIRRQVTSIEDL